MGDDTDRQLTLIERLQDEADQCRADGAGDIAALLDEAWRGLQSQQVQEFGGNVALGHLHALVGELRGEIARLHGAVCQAVALLNRAPAQCAEALQAHTILREVLALHADNAAPNDQGNRAA